MANHQNDLMDILQCPSTGKDLHWTPDGQLGVDGGAVYTVVDGIAGLLPRADDNAQGAAVNDAVREFYETKGWIADDKGVFAETKAFSDTRTLAQEFTDRCIKRIGRHFKKGGKYLLDAGSGPIPYDELMRYGDKFEKRVCVDLSVKGLWAAKQKLGDRGIYLQGDLTRLPLKTGSMDAVTCNHVIYQIPPEHQVAAWLELWRVLKPGGTAVVVYLSPSPRLNWRLERVAKILFGEPAPKDAALHWDDELPINVLPLSWFTERKWPFSYKLDSYRVVTQNFMRDRLPNDWRGRAFLNVLYAIQSLAPQYCGKNGSVPAFIIRKPETATDPVTVSVVPAEKGKVPAPTSAGAA
ncbi:MAG: class I SAM-dependent methyltransferase [Hyphomonadaceae bacterium]